ncbi:MAG: hypothetical protein NTW87_07845 [Planctomycetota bacterium]|nr:hypothetical protein [Planctomycetota bacterium]
MRKPLLPLAVALLALGAPSAESPATASSTPLAVREVIVICKTHFDIGYTHRVKEVVQYYRTAMIDKALEIMDASMGLPERQRFAWTAPGWVMAKVLEDWPGQSPERRRRLDEAFKSGRFVTHALPFTLESDACEVEEMARGFGFASALSRRYGLPLPRSGKMTDVPGHTGALATVLANGGVKFMHIGCNWPSGFVRTPGLFWWEGPDGSRVLTMYSCIYGTCTGLWPPQWLGKEDTGFGRNLLPPPNWPHRTWPAIIVTPDNSGPPTAAAINALFEEANQKLPGTKVRMGTMDDFAAAILAEKPDLPVVKGEMPDTWIHGVMSDPGGMRLSRETHPLLSSAEVLHTQLGIWGVPQAEIAKDVALAYEQLLLYGEHTWGVAPSVNQYGDFRKIPPQRYANLEASWEDKTDYIRTASKITRGIWEGNLKALAVAVKHEGPAVIVYNPLPWKRSGIVEVNGKRVFASDVPPCGYRVLTAPAAPSTPVAPSTSVLENSFFRLTLDPARGTIASLVDKRTGREWVDTAAEHGLGQYLNERFTYEQTLKYTLDYQQGRAMHAFGSKGDWPHPGMVKGGMISEAKVPYRAASPANGTLKVSTDSVSQTGVLDMPANPENHLPAASLRVTLPASQPYLELEITIRDKAKDNWPEADWLCLPFQVAHPTFRVARPLGVMDPAADILPGANRHLYAVGHGVAIADADGSGVAVCPMDHPLVSLDRPGCWKFSLDFVPRKPVVFLSLFNNQWNTNFRYWYPGTWSSRVRLWTFDAKTASDAVIATPALEARNPLVAVAADGGGGTLPAEQPGLFVSRKGVIVTAFGADPDGNDGTCLRLWEQAGVSGDITVTLPTGARFTTATPVNLRGEKTGEPIPIRDGSFVVPLNAYAPASFVMRR